jgi:hypothetical protein
MITLQEIERRKEKLREDWRNNVRAKETILMQVRLLDMAKDCIEKRRPPQEEIEFIDPYVD